MSRRLIPFFALTILAATIYLTDLHQYLKLSSLRLYHDQLQSAVQRDYFASLLLFFCVYSVAVAVSLPGSTVLTIGGGLLFGPFWGSIIAVVSATVGATLLFVAARTTIGEFLRNKSGSFLEKIGQGFDANAFNYLLFMRLVPVFPFWAVNLASAFTGIGIGTYVIATFLGIMPGTAVYAYFGSTLTGVLAQGEDVQIGEVFSPSLVASLIVLGGMALLPVGIRIWRER